MPTDSSQYCFGMAFAYPQRINISENGRELIDINSLEELVEKGLLKNLNGIERCTKEDFYNSANNVYKFRIYVRLDQFYTGPDTDVPEYQGGVIKEYEFEPWMTFNDWFNSKYNTDDIKPAVLESGSTDAISVSWCRNGEPTRFIGHTYDTISFNNLLLNHFYSWKPNGSDVYVQF